MEMELNDQLKRPQGILRVHFSNIVFFSIILSCIADVCSIGDYCLIVFVHNIFGHGNIAYLSRDNRLIFFKSLYLKRKICTSILAYNISLE